MKILDTIRLMEWIGPDRVRGYSVVLAIAFLPLIVHCYNLALTSGVDFASFWAAGQLAWRDPILSYSLSSLASLQTWVASDQINPFSNPPPFLLVVSPFGLLPFWLALPVFVASTLGFYLIASRWLRAFWPSVAFTPTIMCICGGQNGLLTGGLFLAAASLLERRPFIAGLLLGGLIIKPQLAILVPIAFIFGNFWRAFWGAATSSLGLLAISWCVFGTRTFVAFSDALAFQQTVLFDQSLQLKMQTVFTQAIHLGAPVLAAASLQIAVGSVAAIIVAMVWRTNLKTDAKFSVLAACTPFATPYLYGYDLSLMLLPIVWLARRGPPLPWERAVIVLVFLSPLLAAATAPSLGFNPGLAANALLLACVLRRVRAQSGHHPRPVGP